jgi:RNA-directed DNA polymerase
VVKKILEPILEPIFDQDSFGYRPGKSAHDAIAVTRQRCWRYDWVVEFDIKGLFDHIDHGRLMKALRHHCTINWVFLYVESCSTGDGDTPGRGYQSVIGQPVFALCL